MPVPLAVGHGHTGLPLLAMVALAFLSPASAFLHPGGIASARAPHHAALCGLPSHALPLCLGLGGRRGGAASRARGLRETFAVMAEPAVEQKVANDTPVKGRTVFVAGATGRVGSAVVQQLLERSPTWSVVAGVRSEARAEEQLGNLTAAYPDRLRVAKVDLEKRREVADAMEGVDQVVWCGSGFSGRSQGRLQRLKFLFRIVKYVVWNKLGRVLDLRGAARAAKALRSHTGSSRLIKVREGLVVNRPAGSGGAGEGEEGELPRLVMLSSAAVTRPSWSEAKKQAYPEAYNIPIVKLNPLGLLDVKREGENKLRSVGESYTIVRSCGINATHPSGRIEISTGDTAVGRINPTDLARVLVTMLDLPSCTRKTFEVYAREREGTVLASVFDRGGTKGDCQRQLEGVTVDDGNVASP